MIDLKKETVKRVAEKLQVPESSISILFDQGLMDERTAKKFLVRLEFNEMNPAHGHKIEIMEVLANKFCTSLDTIWKYIHI
jgi:hypothetical protein